MAQWHKWKLTWQLVLRISYKQQTWLLINLVAFCVPFSFHQRIQTSPISQQLWGKASCDWVSRFIPQLPDKSHHNNCSRAAWNFYQEYVRFISNMNPAGFNSDAELSRSINSLRIYVRVSQSFTNKERKITHNAWFTHIRSNSRRPLYLRLVSVHWNRVCIGVMFIIAT